MQFKDNLDAFAHYVMDAISVQSEFSNWDTAALELFRLQFDANRVYRDFCLARGAAPEMVISWQQIPVLPIAAFKEFEVTSIPSDHRSAVFLSSGTTNQPRSHHFHSRKSLTVYEASALSWFASNFPAPPEQIIALTPGPEEAPQSSLVHMFEVIRRQLNVDDSAFAGSVTSDGQWRLDHDRLRDLLARAAKNHRPVLLLGTAFLFVHLLDWAKESPQPVKLPEGSIVLETGGYKGQSRVVPKQQLYASLSATLGIPISRIVAEYGMCELSSQAYDHLPGSPDSSRRFVFPPWARIRVTSPETGAEVEDGELGVIQVFDLANVYSVMALQTEDLGIRRGPGFELLGRAVPAEPRGCSLMSVES